MQRRITRGFLESLSNQTNKDQFYRDVYLRGFGVKVSAQGTITYICEGRIKRGPYKRVTIGRYPSLSLSEARTRAHDVLRQFRDGVDPIAQERESLAGNVHQAAIQKDLEVPLEGVMERFFRSSDLKSENEYRNVISSCFSDWLRTPIREITRQDIERRYYEIAFRNDKKPYAAKAMRYLSSIMNYAKAELIEGERLLVENPVEVLMRHKEIYEIDGARFSTLEEFYEEISNVLIPGACWGKHLDAFNEILRGGFGTPEEGFTIRWVNSEKSKERLGYTETVRQLQKRLKRCHPSNRKYILKELTIARKKEGPTVFDWLVEIINDHCPEGEEAEDGVELIFA